MTHVSGGYPTVPESETREAGLQDIMSRSKTFFQGASLGRVQRSEYDDAKMRDIARHDAKLGESLRTVERARNVMKKSMEAEKHLFIRSGSQPTTRAVLAPQWPNIRAGMKATYQLTSSNSVPKIKRSSVTEMPSDIERAQSYRGHLVRRPNSFEELLLETSGLDTNPKTSNPDRPNEQASASGPPVTVQPVARVSESNPTPASVLDSQAQLVGEIVRRGFQFKNTTQKEEPSIQPSMSKSPTNSDQQGISSNRTSAATGEPDKNLTSKVRRMSRTDQEKINSSKVPDVQAIGDVINQTSIINESKKNKITGTDETKEDEELTDTKKKPSIWETLSVPKHMSTTKSKRNRIELEFSTARLKTSKSSPSLYTASGPVRAHAHNSENLQRRPGIKVK